jgi:hypothetical protein
MFTVGGGPGTLASEARKRVSTTNKLHRKANSYHPTERRHTCEIHFAWHRKWREHIHRIRRAQRAVRRVTHLEMDRSMRWTWMRWA